MPSLTTRGFAGARRRLVAALACVLGLGLLAAAPLDAASSAAATLNAPTLVVDAPAVASPTTPGLYQSSTPTIVVSGTADADTSIGVLDAASGDLVATATSDSSGAWSTSFDLLGPATQSGSPTEYGLTAVEIGSSASSGVGAPSAPVNVAVSSNELVTNGDFSTPAISGCTGCVDNGTWANFPAGVAGWTPTTTTTGGSPGPTTQSCGLELQTAAQNGSNGTAGMPPYQGDPQYAELESNCVGGITQTVATVPGTQYVLSFAYAARPGTSASENTIAASFGSTMLAGTACPSQLSSGQACAGGALTDGSGLEGGPTWQVAQYSVRATSSSTTIEIDSSDPVTADSTGGFVDGVSLVPTAAIETNTSWPAAQTLQLSSNSASASQPLDYPGEALWYAVPVVPDQQVTVSLANTPGDYTIAAFSDIAQAYKAEGTSSLATLGAEGTGSAASFSAFSPAQASFSAFSPSAASFSAFSPSATSFSAFSPAAASFSAFSPAAASFSAFSPAATSFSAFSTDYADAQLNTLLAVSTTPGAVDKSVTVDTWNNTGDLYIRITGNNGADVPFVSYDLSVTTSGSPCQTSAGQPLSTYSADIFTAAGGSGSIGGGSAGQTFGTVIVDNSSLMPAVSSGPLSTALQQLAQSANGVILDASESLGVDELTAQAKAYPSCPYAENLVAGAIQQLIDSYRVGTGANLQDVVLVGDDDVIPFFRYPDTAGLAPESLYNPPLLSTSAAGAALQSNDYLSDDQYGAASELVLHGVTVPLPTAAVGRLVETPADIVATIDSYLAKTTITPTSSLVTGYDFMAPPANEVASAFAQGIPGGTNDQLIAPQGQSLASSWTATQLLDAISSSHHDLAFFGGHFSANNLLGADGSSTATTAQFAQQVGTSLAGSLVLGAGCHAGYGIDPADAVPYVTDTLAWPQAFSEAGATLIAGTGYQYGDTNYVAYSDQLYVDIANQLDTSARVTVGSAMLAAEQEYLSGLASLDGLEEKAMLETTLYGLPMLGVAMPGATSGAPSSNAVSPTPVVTPAPVSPGTPGSSLGLSYADLGVGAGSSLPLVATPTSVTPPGSGTTYTYDSGSQGVTASPGTAVLPVDIENVGASGTTLRGVGFFGGSYTDSTTTSVGGVSQAVTPLTGDPTTDTSNAVVPFASPVLYPQTMWNPNYFNTLLNGGDTDLALTPVQYVSEPGGAADLRSFTGLHLGLFYSNETGGAAFAQPPSISEVAASDVSASPSGSSVQVSATVTGDPAAGLQQVWVTYTDSSSGPLHGTWSSVALAQDPTDPFVWSGTITSSDPNPAADMVFMVQAANGVGEVSLANNGGAYFTPSASTGVAAPAPLDATTLTLGSTNPGSGAYGSTASVSASLADTTSPSASLSGDEVTFTLGNASVTAPVQSDGTVSAAIPLTGDPGPYTLQASFAGGSTASPAQASSGFTIDKDATTLVLNLASTSLLAGQDDNVTAKLSAASASGSAPLELRRVYFVVSDPSGAPVYTTSALTNASGVASAGPLEVPASDTGSNGRGYGVAAYFGTSVPYPGGSFDSSDPYYEGATDTYASTVQLSAPPTIEINTPSLVTATGASTVVTYQATAVDYDGSTSTPSCSPSSGSGFALGQTTIQCSATDAQGNSATKSVSVTVQPAPLVLAVSGTETYGAPPSYSFSASGLVGNDQPSVIGGALSCSTSPPTNSSSPAGSYAIVPGSCSGLTIPGYYTVSYTYGKLVIGQAPLVVTASDATISYGSLPPVITPSYLGLVSPDTAPQTPPTCTTSATDTSQPGSYPSSCSGAADPNYAPIRYLPGTVHVTASTMLLLGTGRAGDGFSQEGSDGGGVLSMSGEATLAVHGDLAFDSSLDGSIALGGKARLTATGSLVSPASAPVVTTGRASVSSSSIENRPAENDPEAALAPPVTTGLAVHRSSHLEGPGVYTDEVSIDGRSQVTLASGVYIFEAGLDVSGEAKLTSASGGVLVYFDHGSLSVSGRAVVDLTPLSTGSYAGIAVFAASGDREGVVVTGQGSASLGGLAYLPTAGVQASGQATFAASGLVCSDVAITGQAALTVG